MNVLITGASSRLGRELAWRFTGLGYGVALHYHQAEQATLDLAAQLRAQNKNVMAFQYDLAALQTRDQAIDWLQQIQASLGTISLLVNNSSVFAYDQPGELDPSLLLKALQVNAVAPVLLMDVLLALNVPKHQPTVINVLDVKVLSPNPDYLSYTLGKNTLAAAVGLYAMHYQGRAKIYGLAPAMFAESGSPTAGRVEQLIRHNPLSYPLSVTEVAGAAVQLAHGHLSSGYIMAVDGGQILMQLPRDVAFLREY